MTTLTEPDWLTDAAESHSRDSRILAAAAKARTARAELNTLNRAITDEPAGERRESMCKRFAELDRLHHEMRLRFVGDWL